MYCLYADFTILTTHSLWRLKLLLKTSGALIVLPETANALRVLIDTFVLQLHLDDKT